MLLNAPFYNDDSLKRVRDMLQSEPLKVDLHAEADHMNIESRNGESRLSIFRRDSQVPSNLQDLPFQSVYCYYRISCMLGITHRDAFLSKS